MVKFYGQMEIYTKESGPTTASRALANIYTPMAKPTKETSKMTKSMVKAFTVGQMASTTKVSGIMAINTAMATL